MPSAIVKLSRPLAGVLLALLLSGCALTPTPSAAPSSAAADARYQQGDYRAAVAAYLSYLQQAPDDAEAWFRLGNAYVFSGQLRPATQAYEQVLALHPEHAQARHNLGLIHVELGVEALLQARQQLPAVDPQASGTMHYLACVMEIFMGRPNPVTCREGWLDEEARGDAAAPAP